MSVNGILAGSRVSYETRKSPKTVRENAFSSRIGKSVNSTEASQFTSEGVKVRTTSRNSAMEAYLTSSTCSVRDVKQTYENYQSENYKIVPDNEALYFYTSLRK